ncbi:metallophosphoesterase [Cellulomonas bogoriensis]|uniref:Metallophosphoesterase n=1 Tax=Cellulomonas bogoriensis 69B4 = DSM 16987 TaxID=1386082 RepID=A0A0A0C0X9_9CELL|nr:metallophosphoesterase [Cellulomonas bogoriensis]KGM13866.1 metallophosphoesterase [Cellulomonas bogoriensis 69B4 = DSM 16987]
MRARTAGRLLGAAALTGAAALAWGVVERGLYTLREVTVPVLPPGAEPLRVLHISDLHLTPFQDDKIAWVRDLAGLEPDLVVDTGDNMAHPDVLPSLLHALDPLLGVPGAFVMGSNDYYAPAPKNPLRYLTHRNTPPQTAPENPLPAGELAAAMRMAGWIDLTNRRDTVEAGGHRISLVGVDDAHLDRDRFPAPAPEDTDEGPTALHLGVAHAPYRRVLDAMHADGTDLVMAGHTHGGQVCVPWWGALVTNCDLDTRRVKGLHGWPGPRPDAPGGAGSTWMHVSAGLGTSPYAPVRFACRPEATLLTLVPR